MRFVGTFLAGAALVLWPWSGVGLLMSTVAIAKVRAAWRVPRGPLAAALLVLVAGVVAGDVEGRSLAWLVAIAIVVAIGRRFATDAAPAIREAFSNGLLLGLLAAAAVTVVEAAWNGHAPLGLAYRSQAWWAHPNLWGASVLAPAVFLVGEATGRARAGRVALVIVAAAVVAVGAGSRAAVFGLLAGVLVLLVLQRIARDGAASRRAWIAAAVVLVGLVAFVGLDAGWRARLLGSLGVQPEAAPSRNLFQASEDLLDGVWWSPNVAVARTETTTEGAAVHRLERLAGRWTDRVQQRVSLVPDTWYTFSADVIVVGSVDPVIGFVGWAAMPDGNVEVVVRFPRDAEPQAHTSGGADLGATWSAVETDGWRRVRVTFRVVGDAVVPLEVGLAPRIADVDAAPVLVRHIQFEAGAGAGPYEATSRPDRTAAVAWSSVRSRVEGYRSILDLVAQRPWTGWGGRGLAELRANAGPLGGVIEHEHSLVLFFALRYGALGLAALVALVLTLVRHGPWAVAVVVAVGTTNVVDLTFASDAVYVATALLVAMGAGPAASGARTASRASGVPAGADRA